METSDRTSNGTYMTTARGVDYTHAAQHSTHTHNTPTNIHGDGQNLERVVGRGGLFVI